MGNESEKPKGEDRPVNVWDKVHAVGIFILGIAAVVMVGSSLIDRIASAKPQPVQQPVAPKTVNVLSPYGLPPVQTIDGQKSKTPRKGGVSNVVNCSVSAENSRKRNPRSEPRGVLY